MSSILDKIQHFTSYAGGPLTFSTPDQGEWVLAKDVRAAVADLLKQHAQDCADLRERLSIATNRSLERGITIDDLQKRVAELERDVGRMLEANGDLVKELEQSKRQVHDLLNKTFAHFSNEECWIYQGEGDRLESLTCPVVISAAKLLELKKAASVAVPLSMEQIESCFPEGSSCDEYGNVIVSAQWLHDFAHAVSRLSATPQPADPVHYGERAKKANELIQFLNGSGPLEGKWFGEKDGPAAFWWRKYLPSLLSAALNYDIPQPAVAEPESRDLLIGIAPNISLWRITFLPKGESEVRLVDARPKLDKWGPRQKNTNGLTEAETSATASAEPNDEHVICPNCTTQFRAIPVQVQSLLLGAGYEPPFLGKPAPLKVPSIDDTALLKAYSRAHSGQQLTGARRTQFLADARLGAELLLAEVQEKTCEWSLSPEFDGDTYESACGEKWSFIEGGIAENGVRFCQGCGGRVVQKGGSHD